MWIESLLEFVCNHDISIILTKKLYLQWLIEENQKSFEKIEVLGYAETDMVRLKRLRNFLKLLYVSDITKKNWKK